MFRESNEKQEKYGQGQADQQVLHRVNGGLTQNLGEEKAGKSQSHEEHSIFHGTFGLQIDIHRINEADAEDFVAMSRLGGVKVACQMRDVPLCFETTVADCPGLRQKAATEIGVWPIGFEVYPVGFSGGSDGQACRAA